MALKNFVDYCRLCQNNIGIIPINDNSGFLKKIEDITRIKITECHPKMPPNICTSCRQQVIDIEQFIDMVQKTDKHLQKLERLNRMQEVLINESCANKNSNSEQTFKSRKTTFEDENTDLGTHVTEASQKYVDEGIVEKRRRKPSTKIKKKYDPFCEGSSEKQNYQCKTESCTESFSSQYSLKIHQFNHAGNPRPFLCVTCGKDFTTRSSLSCHEKIHSQIKGYRCDLCNIEFSVRSNLRAHIRKYHEGVRFQCSLCSKQFLTKCSLERHEKLHTGIREFKCETCTSEFYTNKELMKHLRYHQGLKQHKCQECFKSFFERHHLIIHLRSHSGERPYVCEIPGCGKSFVESQKLKRHHKAKHIVE